MPANRLAPTRQDLKKMDRVERAMTRVPFDVEISRTVGASGCRW
jgi:hypothetical protein